jgi:hypothetical protein
MFEVYGVLLLLAILLIVLVLIGLSRLAVWLGSDDHYRGMN